MSLTDYSSLEKEISGAPEPKNLKAGEEVLARIVSVREGVSDKNDAQYYQPVFDVPDDPMIMEFNDFFWDLADADKIDYKQVQRNLHKFKTFAEAFDIDYSRPFSWTDDLPGKIGWIIVGFKKDDVYGDGNTVRKYIIRK